MGRAWHEWGQEGTCHTNTPLPRHFISRGGGKGTDASCILPPPSPPTHSFFLCGRVALSFSHTTLMRLLKLRGGGGGKLSPEQPPHSQIKFIRSHLGEGGGGIKARSLFELPPLILFHLIPPSSPPHLLPRSVGRRLERESRGVRAAKTREKILHPPILPLLLPPPLPLPPPSSFSLYPQALPFLLQTISESEMCGGTIGGG